MALSEADLSMTEQAMAIGQGNMRPGDETLLVRFYLRSLQNEQKSEEAGRPIFEDVEYISIRVPGNKNSSIERPIRKDDLERFPRHYQAFKNREEAVVEGTPLESWPGVTRSQVEELRFFNVHTVEQLAEISDSNAQNFMGIQLLRTRAKTFLEAAKENANNEKMAAELASRDEQIAALQNTVSEMAEELKALRTGSKDDSVRNSGSGTKRGSGRGRARTES